MAMNFCSEYPLHLGIFGSESHSLALRCIAEADCIIVLGAGLNSDTTSNGHLLRNKAVVRCDSDLSVVSVGSPRWISVLADVKLFAAKVNSALESALEERDSSWTSAIGQELNAFDPSNDFVDASEGSYVDLRSVMVALDGMLPSRRVVVTDTGRFKTAPWRHLLCTEGSFTQSGSFKGIGLGLPMAIGASFAHRDVVTICVAGDGGAMMSVGELAVAVEHRLPLLVVIANDAAYGSEYSQLEECGLNPDYARRRWPTLASLGSAFGARGFAIRAVKTLSELEADVRSMDGPMLLDVKLNVAVNPRRYR
jgi:thiamine pyrophosphate-dependent acetolactate synthase large subunit-like protein